MCGIVGCIDTSRRTSGPNLSAIVNRMAGQLSHRGPDDFGSWSDEQAGVALGHRRLSILDLSSRSRQPMDSSCERFYISFNGEIYNFLELKRTLQKLGHTFRGTSDTEVLLAAISEWGLDATLDRINGMFAFAIWDRQHRRLELARDRLGEKPLYYGWLGPEFVFGSELKALVAHPKFDKSVDQHALALYMRLGYIPEPWSIFESIYKLPPGCKLTINADGQTRSEPERYWSLRSVAQAGVDEPFQGSDDEGIDELHRLLLDSVGMRMLADVPLGAFLSGGIDSSTIVALMQHQSSRPVKTFTIGFHEKEYDEACFAKKIAAHLGTDHTELYVNASDAARVIPRLPALYDEPFADSSQIPTFLVSELARTQVTVALSGDGGDELFTGYGRYFVARQVWRLIGWTPAWIQKMATYPLKRLPSGFSQQFSEGIGRPINRMLRKASSLEQVLPFENQNMLYDLMLSSGACANEALKYHFGSGTSLNQHSSLNTTDFMNTMRYRDFTSYLPDDILVKLDRASMGVSLESRVPFLDHRLVEFAWRLPLSLMVRGNTGKYILRKVLEKYMPPNLFTRQKRGFGLPIGRWLRGPLRHWCEDLLSPQRLGQEGYFNVHVVREKWSQHLAGTHDWTFFLWNTLMFQAWLSNWGTRSVLERPSPAYEEVTR